MATSQNGWEALEAGSPRLYRWCIPTAGGDVFLTLRNGSAGFLLCHLLLWLAEEVEPLAGRLLDDWGWAWRAIRGQTTGLSNHASGTAADANATRHPLGVAGTFGYLVRKLAAAARIRRRLKLYAGTIRWGGDYTGRKDEMHFEIVGTLAECEAVARLLLHTDRGRRLIAANPTQRAVILS